MTLEKRDTNSSRGKEKIVVIIPAFNEEGKTVKVVQGIPKEFVDETVVVDDGSTDKTPFEVKETGATVLRHGKRLGIGAAIRTGIEYALRNNFTIIVVMAGNGKDGPEQIPQLLEPLLKDEFDYIQGSRYIAGGYYGKMPLHRFLFTKMYSLGVRMLTGFKISDGTNGFRAYKTSILEDERINLYQEWLNESLEYYLSIKVIKLKYRIKEVPVAKIYPSDVPYQQYTKVKPFSGWLKRLKPLFYLTLAIKK